MMKLSKEKRISNRAEAINNLHSFLNKVTPLLRDRMREGYKRKDDGTLYKKDRDDLRAIIDAHNTHNVRAIIDDKHDSLYLKADTHYQINEHGVAYFEQHPFIYSFTNDNQNEGNPRHFDLITAGQVEQATLEAKALNEEITALVAKHRKLVRDNHLINADLRL